MYKKILAFVLSTMMLAQTASAANLYDFVNDPTKIPAQVLTDNQFDYAKFKTIIDREATEEIPTTAHAFVSLAGANDYRNHITSNSRTFDFKVTLDTQNVKNTMANLYSTALTFIENFADPADKDALLAQFDASYVQGDFIVEATVDEGLTGFESTDVILQQEGRDNADAFVVTDQTWDEDTRTATVIFSVAPGITIKQLYDDLSLLNNLYVVSTITATTRNTELAISAALVEARSTFVDGDKAFGFVEYISNEDTASVSLTSQALGTDGLKDEEEQEEPPVVTEAPKAYLVTPDASIDVDVEERDGKFYVDVDTIEVPAKEGFVFEGLYFNPTFTDLASGVIEITEDTYLYPKYINVTAPGGFISDEHIVYIAGYPDGEVKPNNNITREEVVAALYRLLKDDVKASIDTTSCSFPDVEADRWSYESIAAFANAGYVVGDPTGNFNPGNPITRAEFVTIVNKFAADAPQHSGSHFTDISGHWAENSIISSAIDWSWVTGYEDNTFRPDSRITRAEAVTIINKMLVRYADVDCGFAKEWPDLNTSDWYYGAMIEATTEHNYTRKADGWSESWSR